jgi:hypothetical protein
MDPWQATLLVLIALVVGALLPAVVQLSLALRAARRSAAQAERTLAVVGEAAQRIERIAGRLEQGGRVDRLVDGIDSLSRTVTRLQETVRVASAVGAAVAPAVGAAVRAWRGPADGAAPDDADGSQPEH